MRQRSHGILLLFICILFSWQISSPLLADEARDSAQITKPKKRRQIVTPRRTVPPPVKKEEESDRILVGHRFLRNGVLDFPFTSPYINSSLAASMATISVAGAAQDIKSVGLSPTVTGQFDIAGVGVEIGTQLSELFGSDSYSAYVLGAGLDYGFSGGLRFPMIREDSWVLTPAVFYTWDKGLSFSPLAAADNAINDPSQAIGSNLISRSNSHQLRPSLLGAYAASAIVGLTGEIGLGFNYSTLSSPSTYNVVRLGFGIDLDMASSLGVPIGISGFYRNDVPLKTTNTASPLVGAGLYEMVNKNFNFGIEATKLITNTPTLSLLLTLTAYY